MILDRRRWFLRVIAAGLPPQPRLGYFEGCSSFAQPATPALDQ